LLNLAGEEVKRKQAFLRQFNQMMFPETKALVIENSWMFMALS
jgi:hypothetical protein